MLCTSKQIKKTCFFNVQEKKKTSKQLKLIAGIVIQSSPEWLRSFLENQEAFLVFLDKWLMIDFERKVLNCKMTFLPLKHKNTDK